MIILLHNNGIKLTLCNPKFSLTSTYIYISNADHTLKPPKYRNIPSIPSFSFFFLHRKDLTLSNTVDVNYQTYFPRWKRGIKRARRVRTSVPLVPFGTVACHFRSPSSPMSSTTTTTKDREIKKMKKKWGRNGWTRNSIRSRDRFVSNYYAGHIIRVAWLPVEATPRRSPSAHAAKRRDASRGRTNRSTDVELGRGGTNRAKVSTFHLFIILRSPRYPRIFVPISFLSFRRVSNFSNLWDMSIFIKKILRPIYPSMIHVSKSPF